MISLSPEDMRKVSLFAVVIDNFEPYEDKSKNKHFLTVKVIDDTLNRNEGYKKGSRIISFSYLTFCHANKESLPKFKNIGDIIRIRRFLFSFGEKGNCELAGVETPISNWMVFDAS